MLARGAAPHQSGPQLRLRPDTYVLWDLTPVFGTLDLTKLSTYKKLIITKKVSISNYDDHR